MQGVIIFISSSWLNCCCPFSMLTQQNSSFVYWLLAVGPWVADWEECIDLICSCKLSIELPASPFLLVEIYWIRSLCQILLMGFILLCLHHQVVLVTSMILQYHKHYSFLTLLLLTHVILKLSLSYMILLTEISHLQTRKAFTPEQINEACYVDANANKAVFDSLRNNPKVHYDRKRFSYKVIRLSVNRTVYY